MSDMEFHSAKLVRAVEDDQALFEHFYGYYIHDLSEFSEELEPDASGGFDVSVVATYFKRDEHHAFKIVWKDRIVGFILCSEAQSPDIDFVIQDAFVLRGHRRGGIGKEILEQLFETCPGRYWLAVLKTNKPALRFWQGSLLYLGVNFQMDEMDLHGEICDTVTFEPSS